MSTLERREFFRLNLSMALEYKSYAPPQTSKSSKGISRNLSHSGILFQTTSEPPQLSSIVWMGLDVRTLKICQEIEKRALVFNKGLLGRVVRVEEDSSQKNAFDVGVCFLTKDQERTAEVQKILGEISEA